MNKSNISITKFIKKKIGRSYFSASATIKNSHVKSIPPVNVRGNFVLAVFTLEDEQIVWMDKSSQTNKSSDVKTGRTNFLTNKSSDIWPSGKTIFPRRFVCRDEQVDDSTT